MHVRYSTTKKTDTLVRQLQSDLKVLGILIHKLELGRVERIACSADRQRVQLGVTLRVGVLVVRELVAEGLGRINARAAVGLLLRL